MSLIITVYTNEGIIMSSDSRTTFTSQEFNPLPDGKGAIITKNQGIHYSDTAYKTFLASNNVGISTCGAAAINGKPIAGYVEKFMNEKIKKETKVFETATGLLEAFRKFSPVPDTVFHVAGYEDYNDISKQRLFRVFVAAGKIAEINVDSQGAIWNGEAEILSRILNSYWMPVPAKDGTKKFKKLNPPPIPWNFFSLQDAVDFSMYAMNTTIETMRFQERLKTVGKPIDMLAIKPTGGFWIQRKELHA